MRLARFGCWRRPMYRLTAAGYSHNFEQFGDLEQLPPVLALRNLCSLHEEDEESKPPLHPGKHTQIEPPSDDYKSYSVKTGDPELLQKKVDQAVAENNRIHAKSLLQERFDSSMKSSLAARFLLLPKDISDSSTKFLRDQYYWTNKREPHFLSSRELIIHEKRLDDPEEWGRFVDLIIGRRVFIANEWEANVGNIETVRYYYGIKGAKDDSEFYRGEIDASFHDGKDGELGVANVAIVVWKGYKFFHAEVFEGVRCLSIHAAEAHAALALCFYCFENGIRDLELWTDNGDIHGAICGSLTVKQDGSVGDLLLLLGNISRKFNSLISMHKRRELLFLADDLAHADDESWLVQWYLKKWSYELRGKAIFRLSQATSFNKIMKDHKPKKSSKGEPQSEAPKPYIVRPQTKYFMEITELSKLEVISLVVRTLGPGAVYLAINHLEEKPKDYISQVEGIIGRKLVGNTEMDKFSILEFVEGGNGGKVLLIVHDATIPADGYNHFGTFTIVLAGPEERKFLDRRFEEVSALTYVYFNGALDADTKPQK